MYYFYTHVSISKRTPFCNIWEHEYSHCWQSKCSSSDKGKLSYGGGVKGLPLCIKQNLLKLTHTQCSFKLDIPLLGLYQCSIHHQGFIYNKIKQHLEQVTNRFARARTRRTHGSSAKPLNDHLMKTAAYNYRGSIRGTKFDYHTYSHLRFKARRMLRSAR